MDGGIRGIYAPHWISPWRKFTVRLRVWARRFFCDERSCSRKIFAERFTGLLPRHGRRTEEATSLLLAFALRER